MRPKLNLLFNRPMSSQGHNLCTGIEVKQTDCTFQFNKHCSETSCILGERINNESVVFLKPLTIVTKM